MRTHAMTITEFMNRNYVKERPKSIYSSAGKAAVLTAAVSFLGTDLTFASTAADAVDAQGKALYYDIISVGKWILIGKGGIDTIKSATNGDLEGAKKHFFSYLIVYLALLALPWGYDRVEDVFMTVKS